MEEKPQLSSWPRQPDLLREYWRLPDYDHGDVARSVSGGENELPDNPASAHSADGVFRHFFLNVTLLPLLRNPRRHWDSLLALVGHAALIAALWMFGGFEPVFFLVLLPMTIASALGSCLFFAQHSFKRLHITSRQAWSYYRSAMESSSYMRLNKVMQWLPGNIGFHHIHHLNVRNPFYRLPEAMNAIPELQSPVTTTFETASAAASGTKSTNGSFRTARHHDWRLRKRGDQRKCGRQTLHALKSENHEQRVHLEPPTRGFSDCRWTSQGCIFQYVTGASVA